MEEDQEIQRLKKRVEHLEGFHEVENESQEVPPKVRSPGQDKERKTTPPKKETITPEVVLDKCPHCNERLETVERSKVSSGGWILFVILLLVIGWTLIGILIAIIPPLTMKEKYKICKKCRKKI